MRVRERLGERDQEVGQTQKGGKERQKRHVAVETPKGLFHGQEYGGK